MRSRPCPPAHALPHPPEDDLALGVGEVFPFSPYQAGAFDSRYAPPIPAGGS